MLSQAPSAFSRRAVVSYWRKYVHEVLVNRLGGLSLPRKSVVRLTDRHDMTLDVYRGRKTTMQQQQQNPFDNNQFSSLFTLPRTGNGARSNQTARCRACHEVRLSYKYMIRFTSWSFLVSVPMSRYLGVSQMEGVYVICFWLMEKDNHVRIVNNQICLRICTGCSVFPVSSKTLIRLCDQNLSFSCITLGAFLQDHKSLPVVY